jgi:hypothetical protein
MPESVGHVIGACLHRTHIQCIDVNSLLTRKSNRLQGKRQRQRVDYSLGGGDDGDDEDFSLSSDEGSSDVDDHETLLVVRSSTLKASATGHTLLEASLCCEHAMHQTPALQLHAYSSHQSEDDVMVTLAMSSAA